VPQLARTLTALLGLWPWGAVCAHDQWSNGQEVPSWVKQACCGPSDVHHLRADQVHAMKDGWHVDGYPEVLAYGRELPSQDGDYWIFYKHNLGEQNEYHQTYESFSPVYCFFTPKESW
jgi:hypothetical protein